MPREQRCSSKACCGAPKLIPIDLGWRFPAVPFFGEVTTLRCTEALGVESFRYNLRHAATVYTTERTGVFTSASTARIKGNKNSCIFLAWASGTFSK
jgi:hypothetical protein